MAYVSTMVQLPAAGRGIRVELYFPTDLPPNAGGGGKVNGVITLLHGIFGSSSDWLHMTAACRYAADNGYILVAPSADNSFYHDMVYGPPFYTIFTELLPAELDKIFHIPRDREKNYIAGLSMGGYGALRLGLSRPDLYSAIGCFSGAVDVRGIAAGGGPPGLDAYIRPVLGDEKAVPDNADLFALAGKVAKLPNAQQPRIFCTCGSRDDERGGMFIREQNQRLRAHMDGIGLAHEYRQWDGVHEWNFWDRSLAEFIGFIQNSDYGERKKQDWKNPYEE